MRDYGLDDQAQAVGNSGWDYIAGAADKWAEPRKGVQKGDRMHYTTSKNAALGSADQISRIVAVIGDIADESNRIARNASREATRAAEDGHNWALIAEEVRKLAERTTRATREIAQTIEMLQGQARLADACREATPPATASVATLSRADTFADIIHLAQAMRSQWIADWLKGRSARTDL
jgi:hypothetical protein